MAASINFDHGLLFGAIKINDVIADDFLTVKVQAIELPFLQLSPQQHFR